MHKNGALNFIQYILQNVRHGTNTNEVRVVLKSAKNRWRQPETMVDMYSWKDFGKRERTGALEPKSPFTRIRCPRKTVRARVGASQWLGRLSRGNAKYYGIISILIVSSVPVILFEDGPAVEGGQAVTRGFRCELHQIRLCAFDNNVRHYLSITEEKMPHKCRFISNDALWYVL
jgi:hypothetical protein